MLLLLIFYIFICIKLLYIEPKKVKVARNYVPICKHFASDIVELISPRARSIIAPELFELLFSATEKRQISDTEIESSRSKHEALGAA